MRDCSAATLALLNNPPANLQTADLFTFTLQDGVTVYTWTSYDCDLTVNGVVYSSRAPWLQRSRWDLSNTMQVPTLEVLLSALDGAFSGGIDIKAQLTNGLFDGARLWLDRVFFTAGTTVINDFSEGSPAYRYFKWTINSEINSTLAGAEEIELALYPGGPDVAIGKSATATSEDTGFGYYASKAFDGVNTGSSGSGRWEASAYGLPQSITVDLGSGNAIIPAEFRVSPAFWVTVGTNNGWSAVDFYGSNDNVAFTLIKSFTGFNDYTGAKYKGTFGLISSTPAHPGIRLFSGYVSNIDLTGAQAIINVKAKSNLLNQYAPRNLYQLGCEHAFCDAGCTLSRELYSYPYYVGTSPTRTFIPWNASHGGAPSNPGRYRYGTVTFTSGVCTGQSRTIRTADTTGITLVQPLLNTPIVGDLFSAFEGCDKQLNSGSGQDCTARSNTQHWRGFPYVPPADSAA